MAKANHETTTNDNFKQPAKTNVQRQKEYRDRQRQQQSVRLDLMLDKSVWLQLDFLSQFHNLSKKDILAMLIEREINTQRQTDKFKEFSKSDYSPKR